MSGFAESYLGRLRAVAGSRLLLVPSARVVIENPDGAILLQESADVGMWGLPGGNAEPGEDLADTATREVLEETGLAVTDLVPFAFSSDPALETFTFPNADQCQFFVLNFTTRSYTGTLRTDDESTALGWFAPTALPELMSNMRASPAAWQYYRRAGAFQQIQAAHDHA